LCVSAWPLSHRTQTRTDRMVEEISHHILFQIFSTSCLKQILHAHEDDLVAAEVIACCMIFCHIAATVSEAIEARRVVCT